jgi:hypothetical protein
MLVLLGLENMATETCIVCTGNAVPCHRAQPPNILTAVRIIVKFCNFMGIFALQFKKKTNTVKLG